MIYLFDLDGTLTKPRQPMTNDFAEQFIEWAVGKKVYIITGSDLPKVEEQCNPDVLKAVSGIFTCMGCQFWKYGKLVYENDVTWNSTLKPILEGMVERSTYPVKTGNHIEQRMGMINFSILGRNADIDQRFDYGYYDRNKQERAALVDDLSKQFPQYEFTTGGSVSIDITKVGINKSQVIGYLRDCNQVDNFTFVGDKCDPPGNDYAIADEVTKESTANKAYNVSGPDETLKILKKMAG